MKYFENDEIYKEFYAFVKKYGEDTYLIIYVF